MRDARWRDALAAQVGAQRRLVGREALAFDARCRFLSVPSQVKGMSRLIDLDGCGCCRSHELLSPASLDRDAVDFFEAGHAVLDLLEPGAAQIPDAFLGRLIADVHGVAACRMMRAMASVTGITW